MKATEFRGAKLSATLALIKPDAYERGLVGQIMMHMEDNFVVTDVLSSMWTREQASLFYIGHANKPFYQDLIDFMMSAPVTSVILVAPDAIPRWRGMLGYADSRIAPRFSVRGQYGEKGDIIMRNAVHGSETVNDFAREVPIAFTLSSGSSVLSDVLGSQYMRELTR